MPVLFTIYSRPGCHLCDEMADVVGSVAADIGGRIEKVDISGNDELESQFGLEIPVLFINGRKSFKVRVTERDLRTRLRRYM